MIQHTKIMLIDDDADDQLIFKEALKDSVGILECTTANNGIEALSKLRSEELLPSLIFLDLNMPMMNGLECLELIKNEDRIKQIPVIIFSTSNSPEDRNQSKKLGADMFLTKVSDFKSLKTKLRNIFEFDFSEAQGPYF